MILIEQHGGDTFEAGTPGPFLVTGQGTLHSPAVAAVVAALAGVVGVAVGGVAHLAGLEGLDHPVLLGHAPDPAVTLDRHVGFRSTFPNVS